MKILLFVTCTALGGYYAKCNKTEIEILDVITSIWNLKNETNWWILKKKKNRVIDMEKKLMVTSRERERSSENVLHVAVTVVSMIIKL